MATHCHHHGYTLSPQGDHIATIILATLSTPCSHKVDTLLPPSNHTVHTVGPQPDLIALTIFAGHKDPRPVTPSGPAARSDRTDNFCWSQRPTPRYSRITFGRDMYDAVCL